MSSREQDQLDEFGAQEGATPVDTAAEAAEAIKRIDDEVAQNELRSMVFVGQTDDVGLTGLFNTFRIGPRWANLRYGEPILCMVDSAEGVGYQELPRLARVLSVHTGRLVDMLQTHIGLNHAPLYGPGPLEQRAKLQGILEACYGRELGNDEPCTVAYMIRDPE